MLAAGAPALTGMLAVARAVDLRGATAAVGVAPALAAGKSSGAIAVATAWDMAAAGKVLAPATRRSSRAAIKKVAAEAALVKGCKADGMTGMLMGSWVSWEPRGGQGHALEDQQEMRGNNGTRRGVLEA